MEMTFEKWRRISSREKESFSADLARQLPMNATFSGLRQHSLGGATDEIAEFEVADSRFCFVPASTAEIGFDPREWEPNPDEIGSWNETAAAYGITQLLADHLRGVLNARRRVEIPALLVESQANEIGWSPIELTDRRIKDVLKTVENGGQLELHQGRERFRIRTYRDGTTVAQLAVQMMHADVTRDLRAEGFRLPSSDEWEYLCGAGTTSLFRWGDHAPCDCYPTDETEWKLHKVPNAFGLLIAANPYQYELVVEPDVLRGGDGGGAVCGGAGYFLAWIALATAFFERGACTRDANAPIASGFSFVRRVIEL
jgi:hypothetical protein